MTLQKVSNSGVVEHRMRILAAWQQSMSQEVEKTPSKLMRANSLRLPGEDAGTAGSGVFGSLSKIWKHARPAGSPPKMEAPAAQAAALPPTRLPAELSPRSESSSSLLQVSASLAPSATAARGAPADGATSTRLSTSNVQVILNEPEASAPADP